MRTKLNFNMSKIADNLKFVLQRIEISVGQRPKNLTQFKPCLVAVSKTKPVAQIVEAYNAGHRHFGENYIQELEEKANSNEILTHCPDIKWHFIGKLQKNKLKKLISVPNLYIIETIDSFSTAEKANKYCSSLKPKNLLKCMIQVNTSNEDQKSGVDPTSVSELYKQIVDNCKHLELTGLMTIGSLNESLNKNEKNNDFQNLINCKEKVCKELNLDSNRIKLSMGMSNDYETAIVMGSDSVRIGSLIFGSRNRTNAK